MIRGVSTDLAQGPGGGGLHVVLRLLAQGGDQGTEAFFGDDREREGLGEGRNVPQRHDAGQAGVARGLRDVVDEGTHPTVADDELGELGRVLGDFADDGGGVLADQVVREAEAGEYFGEDFGFDHDLGQVQGVLGDLGERRTHLTLQLGVLGEE